MKIWTMRVLGALNIVFVVLGVYYAVALNVIRWGKWPGPPSHTDWAIFVLLSAISLSFLAYLGYSGMKLIRGDVSVLRPLGVLFILETMYLFISVLLFWNILPASTAKIAVGFWEGGEDPLTPQFLTGYPLLGAISVLLLLWTKRRKSGLVNRADD